MPSLLWIIDFDYEKRLIHGGTIRYFNFSRELKKLGISVHFGAFVVRDADRTGIWLEEQRRIGVLDGFTVLDGTISDRSWPTIGHLLIPLGLERLVTGEKQERVAAVARGLASTVHPDGVIVSSPLLLYNSKPTFPNLPTIGDFCDSASLYYWRGVLRGNETRTFSAMVRNSVYAFDWLCLERRAIRTYTAGLFVSEIDKAVVETGNACTAVCIPNGVRQSTATGVVKKAGQIVFSGVMSFEPNLSGALWFLDKVFPAILARHPDTVFIAAGAEPAPELLERRCRNVQVPGFVDDLDYLLAESALFVAPLISGSGFKNKVAEAISSGTFVIGTTMSVEFLEEELRSLVPIGDTPETLAAAVCDFLDAPHRYDARLDKLRRLVAERYSWAGRSRDLAAEIFPEFKVGMPPAKPTEPEGSSD